MRLLPLLIFSIILAAAVTAIPELVNVTAPPQGWPCDEFKVMQKTFIANSTDIYTGVLCPRDSRLDLFSCQYGSCSFIAQAYKRSGVLPFFRGYDFGQTYRYHCYACEGTCALSAREGERVSIPQFFLGLNASIVTSQAPFNNEGVWNTKRGDAGHYNVTVQIREASKIDEATFCVAIAKNNAPAVLKVAAQSITVNEGDTVSLPVTCADPNGDAVTETYSGWMNTKERKTTYTDAGKYSVQVLCLDTEGVGQKATIKVMVLDINRPPEIYGVEKRK